MPRQTLTVQLMHANARIADLENLLNGAGQIIIDLNKRLNASSVPVTTPVKAVVTHKPIAISFTDYWSYRNAMRKWCRESGHPVSYLSQEDWVTLCSDEYHSTLTL